MKRETREHLDDAFNFLAGRWLVGHKLTCFASSSNSVGRAMVTLFYLAFPFMLQEGSGNLNQTHQIFKDKLSEQHSNLFSKNESPLSKPFVVSLGI